MAIEQIKMPQLGESVTEGTISNWLISVGDRVTKYDPLAEVMTDKVNAEIPSSYSGIIKEIIAEEGTTLAVGEVICMIEVEGGEAMIDSKTPVVDKKSDSREPKENQTINQEDQSNKRRYSPAVLRLAQENNIDLEQVSGTGAGGRITRKDLLQLVKSGSIQQQNTTITSVNDKVESISQPVVEESHDDLKQQETLATVPGDIEIPVTSVRRSIATKMVKSKQEIPHAWMMMEVDVTNLVKFRNELKNEFKKKEGFNLTFFAFFVKAVAQALKEFPQINSMWAGDKIIQKKEINISIAVATADSLFVPVIKGADEKTIKGIAREITDLAIKVRSGKLTPNDMQGGTFTINNTGTFGSVQSVGIINHPQAAILQVESIVKRPIVMNNDMIAIRDMVNLCMSLDHRILDGLICGRFLSRVKEILEDISKETTSIY